MKTAKTKKLERHTYRVWIEQVNQTYVDVRATDEEDAKERGYRYWRKHEAHSRVTDVKKWGGNS